ncbi:MULTISPECIES: DUF6520 family protein [unclassified Kaistella]|uniref:DUF6520 family protein n=1 Tax=unclassified Kaistella TaxID=2762626 RepID=UPI00273772DC|nr:MULTISPECIES: DUF6520 family protein [unclassified Kaistella]MDP2452502.1 DUF6520 family protein [Kaistella sp. SH11-4b]MDP2455410.1 DUF6520 family protein [Kaistella sp. SH40-3]MDP2458314.1 DUF6520 family protein [Kaistella sp. SH19-2b]
MKNLKTFLLPAFVMLAGAGSAYATHTAKDTAKAVRPGYAFHPGAEPECVNAQKDCDTEGEVICTADVGMGPEPLYDLNGTSCPSVLREILVK